MYGTREFRFSYTKDGSEHFFMARNIWLAQKHAASVGGTNCKRAPLPKSKPLTTGHCQICAREIGTTQGVIAHHGYRRPWPGSGCQTSSCFGARHVEYAVGHDALDALIPIIRDDIERFKERLADLNASPPTYLTYERRSGRHVTQSIKVDRPADFDPKNVRPTYKPVCYVTEYLSLRARLEQNIKFAQHDLNALTKRRAEWKEPK